MDRWYEYPRPQMRRKQWQDLNGLWDFAFDDAGRGEAEGWMHTFPAGQTIRVPYTYETPLSGIGDEGFHPQVWYHRTLTVDQPAAEKEWLLHFEGCDYRTLVWVNGQFVGEHIGGYTRFSFAIGRFLHAGENHITVKAEDTLDEAQVRGKQRWKKENFACWYVQTTGIWKTVWLEQTDPARFEYLRITPRLQSQSVLVECEVAQRPGQTLWAEISLSFEKKPIRTVRIPVQAGRCSADISVYDTQVDFWGVRYWRPEDPALYDLELRLMEENETRDAVSSYFGMREISIEDGQVLLNGSPYYQKLILDQGYWQESHLTPPDSEALLRDIEAIQRMGYNGLRKHQKTEDERFLYWCDVKGLLVWCEMPSFYRYDSRAAISFTQQWLQVVRQNYNHPSIIVWTPLNESWGMPQVKGDFCQQEFSQAIYHATKMIDPMRPVIVNDGWEHTVSDILTLHDYEENAAAFLRRYLEGSQQLLEGKVFHNGYKKPFADGFSYRGQPILLSEFGGIAWDNEQQGWGYGNKVHSEEEFLKRFAEITHAIQQLPYCCGYCYTQLSDVQQEINGLLTIDRTYKIDPEKIRAVNKAR